MTIFIMNYEWLSWIQEQAKFFTECGHTVIIVDNCSSYKPLLEWYKTCPYKVISTNGIQLSTYNRFIWEMGLPEIHTNDNYYAVTDSDLGFKSVPKNFCEILVADIERNEGIIKCGLGLEIDNLPRNCYADRYRESEKNNVLNPNQYGICDAAVDTTFAVYSKSRCNNLGKLWRAEGDSAPESFLDNRYFYRSHRTYYPYMAQHLPWYMDINNLTEEQQYHIKITRHGSILYFKQIYAKELLELYNINEHWVDPKDITNL